VSLGGRPSARRASARRLLEQPEAGDRRAVVGIGIPSDASPELRAAIDARNEANLIGRCPSCGARWRFAGYDHRELAHATMAHEDDCPVTDENLLRLFREHFEAGGSTASPRLIVAEARVA
jgi:hypothetical protein